MVLLNLVLGACGGPSVPSVTKEDPSILIETSVAKTMIALERETNTIESNTSIPTETDTQPNSDIPPTSTSVPEPTSTSCGPPSGWVSYTVQAGDTLFNLATLTTTTVAEIQSANCLNNTTIIVGEEIFLSFIPIPTSTMTEEITCIGTPCVDNDLPPVEISPGGGNNPDFNPCENTKGTPWIDTEDLFMELGQRKYFYACEFPSNIDSAKVILSNGQSQQINIFSTNPNPDLKMGNAQAVFVWSALPNQPIDVYSLTVSDDNDNQSSIEFLVILPKKERILVVPPAGPRGSTFEVYYTNFGLNLTLSIDLHGENTPSVGGIHYLDYLGSWEITINQPISGMSGQGWAKSTLVSSPSDSGGVYLISFDNRSVFDIFWLE